MPFSPDDPWTCHTAVEACNTVVTSLENAGILERGPQPDVVRGGVVRLCKSCHAKAPNVRKCTGWSSSLRAHNAVVVRGTAGGRDVRILIEGWQDWRHALRVTAGEQVPVGGSISVSVTDLEGNLLTRQHNDIANQGQAGSVGHLQLGGLPSRGERPELEWLDEPRWPMPPMDLVLVAELVAYGFAHTVWASMRAQTTWEEQVQRSESLCYRRWRQQLDDYWERRSGGSTWLAEQCNITTPWVRAVPVG